MKGSLHTDELMGAVVSSHGGIRTERRISHCSVMDVPGYPEPLIITDAAINIAPDLDAKVHPESDSLPTDFDVAEPGRLFRNSLRMPRNHPHKRNAHFLELRFPTTPGANSQRSTAADE